MAKKFRDFESSRKFARNLGLKGQSEWREYCKSGDKPNDIPSNPHRTYNNNGWNGYGDWLGTGNIALRDIQFRDFESARDFVRNLKLKGHKEWLEYCKSKNKPIEIPSNPDKTYKNKGWTSYGDWLGTGSVAPKHMVFRDFKSSRKFARNLGLKGQSEWHEYAKSGKKPKDIPFDPSKIYKNEWNNWEDFLGYSSRRFNYTNCRDFKSAREFVRSLKLKNYTEWKKFCKSENIPIDIPKEPQKAYKDFGYTNLGDWLGTGNISPQKRKFLTFKEARDEVRKLAKKYKLKNWEDWRRATREGKIPKNIPFRPDYVYSKRRNQKRE